MPIKRPESYTTVYTAAIVVAVAGAMLGFASGVSADLGLTRQQLALLGIVQAGLTMLASFLPRVSKPPTTARKGMD